MIVPNSKIYAFQRLLFYAIPFALVSGPFLSDLFAIGMSLIFLYHVIKYKEYSLFQNRFFYFFCYGG